MVTHTMVGPGSKMAARFAHAAGAAGVLANLFLISMYVDLGLRAGYTEAQAPFSPAGELAGPASDLVGSLATACMIPVALALAGRLPYRRAVHLTQAAGLLSLVVLTVGGPLLVLGVLAFEVETPIAMAAYFTLSLWLVHTNRWLRLSEALPFWLTRFGVFLGAGALAGYVVVGLALLLPWMSWPQLVVFGAGLLIGLPAWLCIPVWFLLLGRYWEKMAR